MTRQTTLKVGPYELDEGRFYDAETHLWAARAADRRVRCGFDPLGAETCGDIVAISFEAVGTRVGRGEAFGQVEAAKFVGPLVAPVAGVIVAHNDAALAEPALVNTAPLDTWLVELEPASLADDLAVLVSGRADVETWFAAEVEKFERQGMIAE